jgi:hypothetical protein
MATDNVMKFYNVVKSNEKIDLISNDICILLET